MAVYVGDLLTASAAPVSGKPTPTRTWQWLRGSTAISGATSSTYTAAEADIGETLSVKQIETNIAGSAEATSLTVGPVESFTVAQLFASGEEGAWYEPSTTTCFTDTGGTVAATYGDGVAYLQDLSGNGNHATQVTAGARPILARVPEGGRRNLLTYTDDLSNAIWVARGFSKVGTTAGPSGATAFEFTENNTDNNPAIYYNADVTDGTARTFGVWLKASSPVTLALTTQQVTKTTEVSVTTDWAFYSVTESINQSLGPHIGGFNTVTKGSGVTIYVSMPQQEAGSTATAYQKVVDEYDITEAGVTSLDYLSFDGAGDFLIAGTNSDWNYLHDGTGSMAAFAAKTSEVANPDIISFIFATNSANPALRGSYISVDDRSAAPRNDAWNIRVSNTTTSPTPVFEATSNTISDIDGTSVFVFQHGTAETPDYTFRENGVVVYSGSYGEAPASGNSDTALIIGASDATGANSLDGRLFAAIVRGAASTTQEITNTETYLAARSGVVI